MANCINIPVEFEANGDVKSSMNLISQYHSITLAHCQRITHERYAIKLGINDEILDTPFKAKNLSPATSDPDKKQFYQKVYSNVVAKLIENCLSPASYSDQMLQKDLFTF